MQFLGWIDRDKAFLVGQVQLRVVGLTVEIAPGTVEKFSLINMEVEAGAGVGDGSESR